MANFSRVEDKDYNLELINKIVSELAKEKPQLFTHHQLKSFTSGFNNKVGHGAFGNVYKGVFPDGTQIVVKVLKNNMPDVIQRHDITRQQFIAEVSTMGRTYHRNLIKLYGFCFDADIKALVYEYMENGSLDRVLYENHLRLEWVELYDIAIETAKGLSYLHENCDPIIIHHDIKAANVLLDSSLSPKVTDFGLAKLCKINVSQVAQSRFRGTEGYAAPEVCMGSKLITYKCDVYSFGMMLFEILRRKNNNDAEDWFPGKFWEYFENKRLDEVLIECGIMEKDKEKAKRLSMVALTCADINPQDRPSMSTVVKMLEGEIQPRPPHANPFPYYDSSSGESSISGSSTRTRSLPPVVLPAYDKSLDEEDTTHKEYASSLTVRQPFKDTAIEVISSADDEQVVIPARQLPTSSKEPESNSSFESVEESFESVGESFESVEESFESVEESCSAGVENSVIVYASTVPNSNIPYNGYISGESSLGTRNVPPIVSPAFDEKYKFTPVAGKPDSFFKWLATIEEGSTHEDYSSSDTVRQPLKGSAVNVKGSIDGEKVFNPTRQQSLPKSCEAKESCPPGDDESVVSNAPGHKSGFSLSSFIPSWSRPKTGGSQKGWKLTLGILSTGFIPEAATKGNRIYLLAFEVANTIVKGATLMQSLSKENIEHLKEVVLPSEGVQYLVSKDMEDLLRIAAADKREELKIFSGDVVRFGNRCKDPHWHNLHSYFEKMGKEVVTQKQLKEEAETVMQQLMTMAQYTAELYHELRALDRFEQDYHRKLQEEDNSSAAQRGDSLAILRAELKSQKKHVRSLKKKSLWSKILEEVMEKLVDAVYFLHLEIHDAFGSADTKKPLKGSQNNHQRLGPAGLALHYANIITQIDTLVSRSSSVPPNTRDTLYQGLPPSVKSALRSKLQSFEVKEELTVTQIKAEMEKTLQWLVPIATNTTKAHHSFGCVGEWANTGSEVNRKAAGQTELLKIETLHYADKEKTEACILELIMWLHHPTKSPKRVPTQKTIPLEIFPVRRFPVIDFDMDWNVIEAGSPE